MLQANDYTAAYGRLLAWGIYLGCGLLVLALLFWLTRRWQRDLRLLAIALLAVLMFMPAAVPGHDALTPAFMAVIMGVLNHSTETLAPIVVRFVLAVAAVLILVGGEAIWRRRHLQRHARPERKASVGRSSANR